jgi:HD-GYP domain-containing protein (c-di-GMP phosphodiesterase class II)
MNPSVVRDLLERIERKDLSTAAHTWRVVLYTRALMEHFGLPHDAIELATQAAALHDVGKIEIPDRILQKPGALTDEEFEIVKIHPVTGYARLLDLGVTEEPILDLVRYHHERIDGKGYPYGLAGDGIPIGARMFAVIDSFDALTSVRPYRQEVGERAAENALVELESARGSRYCDEAVDAFAELYRSGKLGYILHHYNDTAPVPDFHESGGTHDPDAR